MKKPDYRKFETPERPRRKPDCRNSANLRVSLKKADDYDTLVANLKNKKESLVRLKAHLELEKGRLNFGYRNGWTNGRIAEIEDWIDWIERILG